MPRKETILSVFVASPSDVSEERDRLDSIIQEINSTHARRTGVRLELLRWERDVSPALGDDGQAVVNDQIPPHDIFIGILWHTIGSPTKRAESGTIEEFELAKKRYDEDPNSVRLMLYFKSSAPLSLTEIDPDQYKRVVDFRSRVSKIGLYREFASADDFANQVRMHLTKHVLNWQEDDEKGGQADGLEVASVSEPSAGGDDGQATNELDEGFLELEDVFQEEMTALSAVMSRMNEAMVDIGQSTNERTQQLQFLQGDGDNEKKISVQERQQVRAAAKRVLKNTSGDMNKFVARLKPELPLFRQHLDRGLGAFAKAVPIYLELNEDRNEDREELKRNIRTMLEAMDGMLTSMESFRDAVHRLPRVSSALVRSRRETEKVLQEVIDIARSGKASLEGALSLLP